MPTPIPFKVIPSGFEPGESRPKEEAVFGVFVANRYQSLLYRLMDQFAAGEYKGGIWELQEFENGAVVWVLPDDTVIQTRTLNGYDPKCSMRTLSLAINMIVMSALMHELAQTESSDHIVERIIDNFDFTKDVGLSLSEYKEFLRIID